MKPAFYLTLLLSLFSSHIILAQDSISDQEAYIQKYKQYAIKEMIRTGVPASITLAQGILESASGKSTLAQSSNNHFGVKCKAEWTGDKSYHDDDAKGECFRVYPTVLDSYKDHSDFLKNRPYYTALFQLDPMDYKGWAYGLKKAGYATEKDYAQNLIALIEKFNLQNYSEIAINEMGSDSDMEEINEPQYAAVQKETGAVDLPDTTVITTQNNSTSSVTEDTHIAAVKKEYESPIAEKNYPNSIFHINNTKVIFVQAGTSLFALAVTYNIPFSKLLEYNELSEKIDILPQSRLVYLAKKPKKGNREFHIVGRNETLDDIAQSEGIQLYSLAMLNAIEPTECPEEGEKLYLRNERPSRPKIKNANHVAIH